MIIRRNRPANGSKKPRTSGLKTIFRNFADINRCSDDRRGNHGTRRTNRGNGYLCTYAMRSLCGDARELGSRLENRYREIDRRNPCNKSLQQRWINLSSVRASGWFISSGNVIDTDALIMLQLSWFARLDPDRANREVGEIIKPAGNIKLKDH